MENSLTGICWKTCLHVLLAGNRMLGWSQLSVNEITHLEGFKYSEHSPYEKDRAVGRLLSTMHISPLLILFLMYNLSSGV